MTRERWGARGAFIMAAIGSAIGLGNVWRFPYMAYQNGGAAFFIPYIIALLTTGIPLVALEYYLGVRYQKGPTEAYGHIRKGTNYIGWFSLAVSGMITIYYAVVMGWSWRFLFDSINVAWAGNETAYFYNEVLGLSKGIGELGGVQWPVVFGNFLTWVAIFLIIFKGVEVVGKIVNWTVGLPWILLLVLIIRGITLEGSGMGLDFYLKPDFSKLLDPTVWLAAYGQIFFSLSLGFGIMIAYASYLPKDSDINTNAWTVSFANCTTSFFAGFAVFSILGYLATSTNQPIDQVVKAGPGLAFVVYPTAIAKLPGGILGQAVFALSFFVMLLLLGIDSAFSLVEGIVTSLKDSFGVKRETACFWVCVVGFFLGFIYTTNAGLYWLDVVDHWMNWGLVIVGILEALLIGWFFDIDKVVKDIDSTSEMKFGKFWVVCVKYITPFILIITMVSNIFKEVQAPYEGYPIWAIMFGGWFLLITLFFGSIIMQTRGNISTLLKNPVKFISGAISYGLLLGAFHQFYVASNKVFPSVLLIAGFAIGIWAFVSKGRNTEAIS